MHYYSHNIGDYRKDTGHLSALEHGIYRQLIDWYYLDEKPIPKETQVVSRRLRLASESEIKALENVLTDFFDLRDDGYHQARCDDEIAQYHRNAEKNKTNGKLGGRPKKTQSVILGNPNETESKGNQEPITINQEPETKVSARKRASASKRCPEEWQPGDNLISWAASSAPLVNIGRATERFKDHTFKTARSDWDAAWRNWIRRDQESAEQRTSASATRQGAVAMPMTFKERDEAQARKRWEEMTGQKWPDNQDARTIDITPTATELFYEPTPESN